MSRNRNLTNLDYILISYFRGRTNKEQEMFIEQWKAQNGENTMYYHQVQRQWCQRIIL